MLILIVILVVLISLWYISQYNSFQKAIIKIDEANSGIDIALTKRFDTLTKLLQVVKQYTNHEINTLEKVINLRQNGASPYEINSELQKVYDQVKIQVENYPELRSSESYLLLQVSISENEEYLSAARRFYNSAIKRYNIKVQSFPSSIIANIKGYKTLEFFEAEKEKRNDVNLEF